VNLILFEPHEVTAPLLLSDPRACHLVTVLKRQTGDSFDAGIVNGSRGKGLVTDLGLKSLSFKFTPGSPPPPADPITLLVGLPRPQTARDILRDATSMGIEAIYFVTTEKGDRNYVQSTLWTSGEWRRHLLVGAEQAFCTRIPTVEWGRSLAHVLETLPSTGTRWALDNYEAHEPLSGPARIDPPVTLALGPERGWAEGDRHLLRTHGFIFAHLGPRVLRTETACIAALTLVKAKLGSL
jgi:16S rRNA (uracil1498-N3)-methyltransferase